MKKLIVILLRSLAFLLNCYVLFIEPVVRGLIKGGAIVLFFIIPPIEIGSKYGLGWGFLAAVPGLGCIWFTIVSIIEHQWAYFITCGIWGIIGLLNFAITCFWFAVIRVSVGLGPDKQEAVE